MTQIAQTRELRELFDVLLESEGYELYMEKASGFVPIGEPVDIYTAINAVSKQQRIFVGIRQFKDGKYENPNVNPLKYDKDGRLKTYTFCEEDYFIVLAEELLV